MPVAIMVGRRWERVGQMYEFRGALPMSYRYRNFHVEINDEKNVGPMMTNATKQQRSQIALWSRSIIIGTT
jgi:hypothetical protein